MSKKIIEKSEKISEEISDKGRRQILLISSQTNKTGVGRYEEILTHAMKSLCNFRIISPKYFFAYPLLIREEKKSKETPPIIHITNQQLAFPLYMMSESQRKRTIVAVHDVIPLQYPLFKQATHLRWRVLDQFFFKMSLRAIAKAEMVICVSHATKKAFLAHVNYPEEKVKVIYEYPAQEFKEKKRKRSSCDILYVGSEMPHKNIGVLLKALAEVKKTIKDIRLIKVGRAQWPGAREALLKQARDLQIRDSVVWYDEVVDLVSLYNSVALVVHPSLHEGFGFPVVEAMACGCPVLCSSKDSLPELGGDAAMYFNPDSGGELAEKIVMILKDKDMQARMRKKGLRQVKKFNEKIFEGQMTSLYNFIENQTSV